MFSKIKDKIFVVQKQNIFIGIIIFFLAALGVFLPNLYGGNLDEAQAYTFSGNNNVATINGSLETGDDSSMLDMIYRDGLYYIAFSSSTTGDPGNIGLYITTSTDGEEWGSPVEVFDGTNGFRLDEEFDIEYNENSGYFGILWYRQTGVGFEAEIIFATSSDAYTWSDFNVIQSVSGSSGGKVFLDFADESNLIAVAYVNDDTEIFEFATSTDGVDWSISTIEDLSVFENSGIPVGMEISGMGGSEIIHTMYIMDDGVGGDIKMDIVYASSSDFGSSWTTTTIAGELNDAAGEEGATSSTSFDGVGFFIDASMVLDSNDLPVVIYYDPQEVVYTEWVCDPEFPEDCEWVWPATTTANVIFNRQNINGTWTTTTLDSITLTLFNSEPASMGIDFNGDQVAVVYAGDDKVITIQIDNGSGFEKTASPDVMTETGNSAIVFDENTEMISVAYTFGDQLSFVETYSGNLISNVSAETKTKLLWIDDTYYLAFSNDPNNDGVFDVFITTSTDGSIGSWSEPSSVLEGIKYDGTGSGTNGLFAFEYNDFGNYFGVAAFSTSSDVLLFSSSSNAGDWSSSVSVGSTSGASNRKRVDLSFADNYEAGAIIYSKGDDTSRLSIVASGDQGGSWSQIGTLDFDSNVSWSGVELTGAGAGSAVFNVSYFLDDGSLIFASSTDTGASWSTTTIDTGLITDVHTMAIGSDMMKDNNENLGILYNDFESLTGSSTSSLHFASRSSGGVWSTTTVESNINMTLSSYPEGGAGIFYNTDKPILAYFGDDIKPVVNVSTSTGSFSFNKIIEESSVADVESELSVAYDSTNEELALIYVTGGDLTFVTTSLEQSVAPVATAIYPVQSSATTVTVTTTISDANSDVTSLAVYFSGDGSDWYSATLGNVTASVGTVVTSSGNISSIDTNVSAVNLTIEWLASADAPAQFDGTAYIRIIPNDGTASGTARTSSVFSIDMANPTAPGVLVTNSVSTSSVILGFPTVTSTDTNFSDYKIFYATSSPVTVANNAFTTSSDVNLDAANFNNAVTTTISGLAPNTTYYFKLFAYDIWGSSTSSAEISTTTLSGASAGITISEYTQTVTEGGTTDTYTIVLDTAPTNDVVITLTSTGDVTTTPAILTFTSANWNTAQTVTTTAINDSLDEISPETATTTFSVASSDSSYNNFSLSPVVSSVTDNDDPPTVTLSESGSPLTEDGGISTITATLSAASAQTVTINLVYSGTATHLTDYTSSSAAIVITAGNTTGTVTVTSVGDSLDEVNETVIVDIASVTNGTESGTQQVTVTITDNDTAGITFSTTTQSVTEGGATDTYTVVLNSQPTNNVVVILTSTDDVTTTPATLTFTSANWNTTQTVTTTAVDDLVDETSPETATTSFIVVSSDSNYNNYSLSPVVSTVTDNDEPTPEAGITLSETTATVAEDSGTDTYTIVLDTQPTSTVTITLTESSADFSISTSTIVFTTSSWDTPQTITVTATSDSSVEGTETANITHTASSSDTDYNGVTIANVVVTITDNDSSGSSGSGASDITPPTSISLLINNGATSTVSNTVTLTLGATGASQMMISNSSNFTSSIWENFTTSRSWVLPSGDGTKYVYVKYRDYSSNVSGVISSSIRLVTTSTLEMPAVTTTDDIVIPVTTSTIPVICPLVSNSAYKLSSSAAIYYITSDCTKRAFTRSDIFFSYFNSWADVKITTSEKLNSVPNDSLGFMPWGPKYDPKYGALVKIVKDPKVYLLLNTEKYWITSELVFNALNYSWNWIEDVDERLLDKYTLGSEITYIDHHPNYTLIKYSNSNRVYRLEPSFAEATVGKQVKRWIVDESTFKSLNFRWDRIVTIDNTEVYEDGANLQVVVTKPQLATTLSYGATGEQVKILQTILKNLGFYTGAISGNYDELVVKAVRAFQVANGLKNVGNVGTQTMELLNSK